LGNCCLLSKKTNAGIWHLFSTKFHIRSVLVQNSRKAYTTP
jgi:hypothetical protein